LILSDGHNSLTFDFSNLDLMKLIKRSCKEVLLGIEVFLYKHSFYLLNLFLIHSLICHFMFLIQKSTIKELSFPVKNLNAKNFLIEF